MVEVFLISQSKIELGFLSLVEKVHHRSATVGLDRKNIPFGDMASYISTFGELHVTGSDPIVSQREAGCLLQHISLSFLIVSSKEGLYEIATQTSLSFLTIEGNEVYETAIVSGTLEQFRTEIINGCSILADQACRYFANKVLTLLEKAGLGRVFDSYSKKSAKDGTFLLTYKG